MAQHGTRSFQVNIKYGRILAALAAARAVVVGAIDGAVGALVEAAPTDAAPVEPTQPTERSPKKTTLWCPRDGVVMRVDGTLSSASLENIKSFLKQRVDKPGLALLLESDGRIEVEQAHAPSASAAADVRAASCVQPQQDGMDNTNKPCADQSEEREVDQLRRELRSANREIERLRMRTVGLDDARSCDARFSSTRLVVYLSDLYGKERRTGDMYGHAAPIAVVGCSGVVREISHDLVGDEAAEAARAVQAIRRHPSLRELPAGCSSKVVWDDTRKHS